MLKKESGYVVDWSKIDKEDKDIETKFLLKGSLTDKVSDKEIYMKGIEHRYCCEGYCVYKTEEL